MLMSELASGKHSRDTDFSCFPLLFGVSCYFCHAFFLDDGLSGRTAKVGGVNVSSLIFVKVQVTYENHPHYSGMKSSKPSPIRIFTNVPLPGLQLPSSEGYRLCKYCNRYVARDNVHCDKCNSCTSKVNIDLDQTWRTISHCFSGDAYTSLISVHRMVESTATVTCVDFVWSQVWKVAVLNFVAIYVWHCSFCALQAVCTAVPVNCATSHNTPVEHGNRVRCDNVLHID